MKYLGFVTPVTWVRLEILKQVQDDRVWCKDLKDPLTLYYSSPPMGEENVGRKISVSLLLLRGLG